MRRPGVSYRLHHLGIPTTKIMPGARYAAGVGMYTSDDLSGPVPIQWHRFTPDSPLHPLIKTQPHVAYQVSDLAAALVGQTVILGPYEPIEGFWTAMIDHGGLPIEFIQTELSDEIIWSRARSGRQAPLYESSAEGQGTQAQADGGQADQAEGGAGQALGEPAQAGQPVHMTGQVAIADQHQQVDGGPDRQ